MHETSNNKVIWIVVDCADKSRIEQWCEEGYLPNLKKLRDSSAYGPIKSTADTLIATPWPTIVTGKWPVEHGYICWMQWVPEQMDDVRPTPDWLDLKPFYRQLGPLGKKVIAIDVPMSFPTTPIDGKEIVSWGSYDKLCDLDSYPPEFGEHLKSKYHKLPIPPEAGELQSIKAQLRTRKRLIEGTEKVGDACRDLLRNDEWDMFIVGLGATHRGGHDLWDRSSFKENPADVSPAMLEKYDNAIRDLYVCADKQVGKMLSEVGDDVTVICMASHGMQRSQSRYPLTADMLDRIVHDKKLFPEDFPKSNPGLLKRVRQAIPNEWRSYVKRQLPKPVQDKLMRFWSGRGKAKDWSQIKAFVPLGDLEGYVRINLKGREPEGIVEPSELDALLQKITDGFLSWKDEKTGQPLVSAVLRGDEVWPEVTSNRSPSMPDLIVRWANIPVMDSQVMVSEQYGKIVWETTDKFGDGRSGHHNPTGWIMAKAPHITPGTTIEDAHIIDLAPTILHQLGLETFDGMRGNVMPALAIKEPAMA